MTNLPMEFDTTNWRTEKILTLEQAAEVATQLKTEGKRLVTVNGSFDILHAGHLDQLEQARRQGDVLFVGINTDAVIRAEKGGERPFVPQMARAAMLAALECVDFVVVMPGSYANEPHGSFLPAVMPHVHVNGPDRGSPETWIEWPIMEKLGIMGFTAVKLNNFSTSDIVDKIKRA